MKKIEKQTLLALDFKSNINSLKKQNYETFDDEKIIYFVINEDEFDTRDFYIAMRNFIFTQKKALEINVDSFIRILDKKRSQIIISSIYSAVNIASHIPFSLKTKKTNQIKHNILVSPLYSREVEFAKVVIDAENFARKLQILPGNILDQKRFLLEVQSKLKEFSKSLKITVLNKKELEKKKMNLLLSVGQASSVKNEPKVIILEYKGKKTKDFSTALIGKGVLFDTGGLSLKPSNYMMNMHHDMSGAAIVAATIFMYAKLKLNINIFGILPLVNNDIGSNAVRINDIITSYSKQTVEITNTDAEGRLILADCATYAAKDLKVDNILTIATLTGAAAVTFGDLYTPVWSTSDKHWEKILESSKNGFELVWRMPFHNEYAKKMESSKIADYVNCEEGRSAGSIVAAEFIKFFVLNKNYIHMDIAGSSEYKKLPIPIMLRTLFELGKKI